VCVSHVFGVPAFSTDANIMTQHCACSCAVPAGRSGLYTPPWAPWEWAPHARKRRLLDTAVQAVEVGQLPVGPASRLEATRDEGIACDRARQRGRWRAEVQLEARVRVTEAVPWARM